jgi:hypothetical protein
MKIDKNIPIPNSPRKNANSEWPVANMQVGDSFKTNLAYKSALVGVSWANHTFPGRKYIARKTTEGVRVWRMI